MVLVSLFGSIAYNITISWAIYYFFACMQKILPWTDCNPAFNTDGEFLYYRYAIVHIT